MKIPNMLDVLVKFVLAELLFKRSSGEHCKTRFPRWCFLNYEYLRIINNIPLCAKIYKQDGRILQSSWFDANTICQAEGAKLITVDSQAKNGVLYSYINSISYEGKIWLGLTRTEDNIITWAGGGTFQASGHHNFSLDPFGEHGIDPSERCAYKDHINWKWGNCDESYAFICEGFPVGEPGRPKVTSSSMQPEWREGETLTATCEAYLGGVGYLMFVITGEGQIFISDNNKTLVTNYTINQVFPGNACSTYSFLTIKLTISRRLNGTKIGCMSYKLDHVPVCSDADLFCNNLGSIVVFSDKNNRTLTDEEAVSLKTRKSEPRRLWWLSIMFGAIFLSFFIPYLSFATKVSRRNLTDFQTDRQTVCEDYAKWDIGTRKKKKSQRRVHFRETVSWVTIHSFTSLMSIKRETSTTL